MKILKYVGVTVLAILLGLTLFLVGSVAIDYAIGRNRMADLTNTTIAGINGNPDVRAFVARPSGDGPHPVVMMIHEFYGLNESIVGKAQALAEEGYFVVAPDTFRGSTTQWIPRAIYQVITQKPGQVNADLDSVYAWLESQPDVDIDRTGIMGFCYGGRASLMYSLHNNRLAATVIFYGSPETDPQILKTLPGPVLGIFGGEDRSIPLAEVEAFENALKQAEIEHEITIYEGQPHAFVTGIDAIRAGGAQGEAWSQMLNFFEKNLRGPAPASGESPSQPYRETFAWRYYLLLVYEHAFGTASSHH